MRRWFMYAVAALAPLVWVAGASAQSPPYGCVASVDNATIAPGGLVQVTLFCPPVTNGWRAAPAEARPPNPPAVFAADQLTCPSAPSSSSINALRAPSGGPGTQLEYSWEVCNCARTACAYTNKVPVTIQGPPPTGCQVTLFGTTGSVQFGSSSGGSLPVAVQNCSPATGLTYEWIRDGIGEANFSASWTDTPAQNPKLGPNQGSSPVSTNYQVRVCSGSACAIFPSGGYNAIVPPASAPAACQVTLGGTSGSYQFPTSVGGSLPLAVSGCTPAGGLTYNWRRDGLGGASTLASWTDTPALNPKLGPNTTSAPVVTGYQVEVCNSSGCGVFPPAPHEAIVPSGNSGGVPACTLLVNPPNPDVGQTITLTAVCTNAPASAGYTWTGCSSTTSTCTDTLTSAGTRNYSVVASNAAGTSPSVGGTVTWGGTPPPTGGGKVEGASTGAAESGFSALLRDDRTLWTWGSNANRTLGDGSTTSRSVPAPVAGVEDVVATASGVHTLALTRSGRVYAWGPNDYGELGIGSQVTQSRPTLVAALNDIVAVAAGDHFSLALQRDGTVWAFGRNHVGQLGDGSGADQSSPVRVANLANVTGIAASFSHAAAVRSDGTVWVWGNDLYVPQNQATRPVQVPISDVRLVGAGGLNTFVVKNDGTVWGWGRPDGGRLGDGGGSDGRAPVQVRNLSGITSIAVGDAVTMAVTGAGTLFGWGENGKGQLGLGNTSPVPVPVPLSAPGSGAVTKAASGDSNFVVDSRGRLFGAGANELGGLGLGDLLETRAPKIVAGISGVTAVAAGPIESVALRSDGSVWHWGGRDPQDVGAANATPRAVPGLSGRFVAIAAGSTNVVAVRDDGAVYGWGSGVPGAPDGVALTPVAIPGMSGVVTAATGAVGVIGLTSARRAVVACPAACPGPAFDFTDVTAVAAGSGHFLVRRSDGSVWALGANDKGQLGNGGTAATSGPVRVGTLTNVASIAAGTDYSVAIQADGTAYVWGLAPPFTAPRLTPTRVPELDGTTRLSAASHVLALDSQSRGRSWGSRSKVGERDRAVPGREPRMDALAQVAAGAGHSLGITAGQEVVAWGSNTHLQLGVARTQASANWREVVDPANPLYTRNALSVVEFLNPTIEFGHYFITIDAPEIKNLDNGGIPNWQRTGRSWRAWLTPESAPVPVKPVYRFHSSRWDSHFYTIEEQEKNDLVAKNPSRDFSKDWVLESIAFYAIPPTTGCPALSVSPRVDTMCSGGAQPAARDCAAGYYPIYRAFNVQEDRPNPKRTKPNHRFTSNWIDIYRLVRFFGFTYEGVAFCAPASTQRGGDLQAFNTYPGDSATPGQFMQFDYWFGNAGPGTSDQATLVAVIPPVDNALILCQAYNGAQCPPQSQWTADALRKGVTAPTLPPGGVLRFTVNGQAPAQAQALSFTSSIGAASESPDPFGLNNAAPVTRTNVKSATVCTVTTTPDSAAFTSAGGTSAFAIGVPAGCAWQATSDQPWATLDVTSGAGAASARLAAAGNGAPAGREAVLTVTSGASTAKVAIRQSGLPPVAACTTVKFSRNGDQYDSNEKLDASVRVETPDDCTWTPVADKEWLTFKSVPGRGSGTLEYAVQANTGEERTVNITIGNRAYYVVQSAGVAARTDAGGGGGDGGSDGSSGDGSGGDAGG